LAQIPKPLVQGTMLGAAPAPLYIAPAGITTMVRHLVLTNTDASPRIVSVYLSATAGSVDPEDLVLKDKTLQPAESFVVFQVQGESIAPGGSLQGVCDQPGVVAARGSGVEVTL
jgi:hypothetical protein